MSDEPTLAGELAQVGEGYNRVGEAILTNAEKVVRDRAVEALREAEAVVMAVRRQRQAGHEVSPHVALAVGTLADRLDLVRSTDE